MQDHYSPDAPSREQVDAADGATVLNFGTNWCGYCRAADPVIERALERHPSVRHVKVEDGSGRPLGRSFRVKLWPTLVFMKDGREVDRLVRPSDAASVEQALTRIDG